MAEITQAGYRKQIIDEILTPENKYRKEESRKRFEIFRDRPLPFLLQKLKQEFNDDTIAEMRTVSSINLSRRITTEKASLYKTAPDRTFSLPSGVALTEQQTEQLDALYKHGKVNVRMKKANQWYELHQQCAIQVLPRKGVIDLRILQPHQYDCIPDPLDPERGLVYIVSIDDRSFLQSSQVGYGAPYELSNPPSNATIKNPIRSDGVNQKIGDADDWKLRARFAWWSKDYNFITDGKGQIIDPMTNDVATEITNDLIVNPIGVLPFVDVAQDKDMEFWVKDGSALTEFDLEFLTLLTDTFFIHKMQGYSQAIIYSEKAPANMRVGPNRILHIAMDPKKEIQPRFEWATPNSDLPASMNLMETFLRLFLSSQGLDPKTVSGTAEASKYSSGVERLLAMIERFEASRDTADLFMWVEQEVLSIMVKWSNLFQGVNAANGPTQPLIPALQGGQIPEDVQVELKYVAPEATRSTDEVEDSVIKRMEAGVLSRVEAIMELRNVSEEEAMQILMKMDELARMSMDAARALGIPPNTQQDSTDQQDQSDEMDDEDAQDAQVQ